MNIALIADIHGNLAAFERVSRTAETARCRAVPARHRLPVVRRREE
jgi:hypothetical protein